MTSDEIRERYLNFFAERGHTRIPSASLVPSAHDPSALLTVAGMHPLKPYFLGQEVPPAPRLTSCQKVFRTVDIDNVGNTARHLTFFEMLGNFSFGDYFKREAIAFAWELSREVFGFSEDSIWVTVFGGDEQLGLGPDEEAIALWREVGVQRARIVECPRSENFWQGGPSGPCGPCSELYVDRGVAYGSAEDLPGGENERFLEYWNLVFMQYDQRPSADGKDSTLEPLPANNIDTGLGLNRMAAILQDKPSVFETDQFAPLIELGEELSGRSYGEVFATDRALRILADHSRAAAFLIADGVVPSNEDRGYVLRRVMRRAIQQGLALELEQGFLPRYTELVTELMGSVYPELGEQGPAIAEWTAAEEEGFGRTLAHGMSTLRRHIEQAHTAGRSSVAAEEVFRLHDTFGFPYEMTSELLGEEGLAIEGDFERLMDEQRARGRASARGGGADTGGERATASAFAGESGFQTRFTGYETELQQTTVAALQSVGANGDSGEAANGASGGFASRPANGADPGEVASSGEGERASGGDRYLVKLAESPFYAAGGGQVSDLGTIECATGDCRARVEDVFRLGDDQALTVVVEEGALHPEEPVIARVDRAHRHAVECNHTATHLLHAALRERLGGHVRQAGSYVGPDKLRFDFSHGQALGEQELRDVEDRVNEWVAHNDPVRPIATTLHEAKRLGAMALFGEKYGEVVRMVQIGEGEYSRELCGGTHVRSTAEIGPFVIVAETSSAANVRRIEALTGSAAVAMLRAHDRLLGEVATVLRTRPEDVPERARAREQERKRLEKALKDGAQAAGAAADGGGVDIEQLVAGASEIAGAQALLATVDVADAKALPALVDRLRAKLPDAAIVLGTAADGRAHLIVGVPPALVQRGVRAGAVVKVAAEVVGGGGGGRDTLAQAGGRDPQQLPQAFEAARAAIEAALED
jgi:alanyl-tRNA synthetase